MKTVTSFGLREQPYHIFSAINTRFPSHIHRTYEVIRVLTGEATAVVDGVEYHLKEGECLAVFPLQSHAYAVDGQSKIVLYVFAPDYLPEFDRRMQDRLPQEPRFAAQGLSFPHRTDDPLAIKGYFCLLGAALAERLPFLPRAAAPGGPSLLDEIFLFVDRHYEGECALSDVAGALNYDYTYLSKFFKQKTGMAFHEYVARFRVGRAVYLLTDSDRSVGEIAFAVGFRSIRTFNRAFQVLLNTTPMAYRRAEQA